MLHNRKHILIILFASLAFLAAGQKAEAQTDSLYYSLDSTTFITARNTSSIKKAGTRITEIDLKKIQSMPQIMGNSDPLNFIRTLPGVQTGSEYDSGIHIYGCDNAHNDISIAGVPVYGASHMFGFFSVFNPAHYSNMKFSRTSDGNRLGGTLQMELPDTLKKRFSGEVSAGFMSAQGSLRVRTGEKSHLRVSARNSYMNLLYKRWLQIDGSPVRYGFGDYNISWMFVPSDSDRIWLEGYYGKDQATLSSVRFSIGLESDWGNYAGAVHWRHTGQEATQHHTIWSSGYFSDGTITQNESALNLNSFINSYGYKGYVIWRDFRFGAAATLHDVQPQHPETNGIYGSLKAEKERGTAMETSLSCSYSKTFAERWKIDAGLRSNFYLSPEKQYDFSLSPDISVSYNAWHLGKVSLSYGWRHQYLFQTGLSNIGLPVEFWFAAGQHSRPQYSQQADLTYDLSLCNSILNLSFNAYYKRLYNQVEYKGDLFDFLNSTYDMDACLLKGDGWNYGLNCMLHKQSGRLTGWISYSLGRSLRQFDNPSYTGIYPASHERIHELNAVCSYDLKKWNFSGTFVYASGAPFTAPEYYYVSAGQIISKLGKHNACRMRPYIRLDLSVTYSITKNDRQENGINFSLYNATGRENDVMYRLNTEDGHYFYGRVGFFLRWVPSISYFHKF